MARDLVTHERLKQLLSYDPDTGIFTWRVDRRCGLNGTRIIAHAGTRAGSVTEYGRVSYVQIRIEGRAYFGHRLAWFYMTGEWVPLVDHDDRCGTNNRFKNLRPATKSQNATNTGLQRNNKTGHKGVYQDARCGSWLAYITKDGRRQNLGSFKNKDDAVAAYTTKARELFGEFARAA